MKKICLVFVGLFLCANAFGANFRSSNTPVRQNTSNNTASRQITNRTKTTTANRSATTRTPISKKNITARTAVKKISARGTNVKSVSARTALTTTANRNSRAASTYQVSTRTFSNNYTTCRDAYFTCMDQFCATQDDTYRRCVCSSRLQKIQEQEGLLSQTAVSLQDFHNYNIDAIPKTAAEVTAMQNATVGEKSIKEDKSISATTLKNIQDVLKTTKQKTIDSQNTFDITDDIQSVWQTTDLIRGSDIANLSGEALYNAVNAQCYEMVASQCASSDLKMVASAYGMYIENDCELLATSISNKTLNANASIRTTRHEMQDARLENYNAHNSLSFNDCVAKVRENIIANTACGENYIHCLDVTGKYLNIDTGEPIYSPDFYQFSNQISLSGDVLQNAKNKAYINLLNQKQKFAQQTLDYCRDVADNVWDEFLRQAIVEISQAQEQRIQTVKHDCLEVVNRCYIDKSNTLKDYAYDATTVATSKTVELSESLCAEKLNTCSNLYGGGPEGLAILISTMKQITDTSLAQECPDLLQTYAEKMCSVPPMDAEHKYPWGCRAYSPGEAHYARNPQCNKETDNPFDSELFVTTPAKKTNIYGNCPTSNKRYTKCKYGYFLSNASCDDSNLVACYNKNSATLCRKCTSTYLCTGGTAKPQNRNEYEQCGLSYIGSLYHKMVRYALQNCTRTTEEEESNYDKEPPESILMAVNEVMTDIRIALVKELSEDCTDMDGIWVNMVWTDDDIDGHHDVTNDTLLQKFYTTTSASPLWGYCKNP